MGTFPTHNQGDNILRLGGHDQRYPANPGIASNPAFLDVLKLVPVLDRMASEVPPRAAWRAPKAAQWDRQTLAEFAYPKLNSREARSLLMTATQAVWGVQPDELSLLYALAYIAGAGDQGTPGSLLRLVTTPGGAQQDGLLGGSQIVSERVAAQLGPRVLLRHPVQSIEHGSRDVGCGRGAWRSPPRR